MLDYSKNRITEETLAQLIQLAEAVELNRWIESMFTGEKINETENRAVLHTALRAPREAVVEVDGINVIPDVHAVLDQMVAFSDQIHRVHGQGTRENGLNILRILALEDLIWVQLWQVKHSNPMRSES